MKLCAALVVLLASVSVPRAAQACTVSGAFGVLGQNARYAMLVHPGESCVHAFTLRGGADALDSITIVERPQSGMAGRAGASSVGYLAPAHPGHDRFTIIMAGRQKGGPAQSRIVFDVDIAP